MAYDKEGLIQQAIQVIEDEDLITIEEAVSLLPISSKTFYNKELHKVQAIKEAIDQNKVDVKTKLRKKWLKADSAALQIALYKLCASNEEKEALGQKVDHTSKGEKLIFPVPTFENEDS